MRIWKAHREFSSVEKIILGVWPESHQGGGELAGRDHYQPCQYEHPKPVADYFELPPQPEMLSQHCFDLRFPSEHRREVLQPQDLEVAYEPKEHAGEEEAGDPVDQGGQLERARDAVAQQGVPHEGDAAGAGDVPPELVGDLGGEAGGDEAGEEAEGLVELEGVAEADAVGLAGQLVEKEEAAEAVAAGDGGEGKEGEGGGGGEGQLDDEVVRTALGAEGEHEVGHGRDGHGEQEKNGPGDGGAVTAAGLVEAEPAKAGAEVAEVIVAARRTPRVRL